MEDIIKDDRFSAILKDPRYKKIPIEDKKVKIDKRFQAMFKDKNFKLKYVMDKRGRPVNYTTSEDLKKFYEITSSESSSEESNDEVTNCEKAPKNSSHTSHKEFDIDEDMHKKRKQKLPVLKQKKNERKLIIAEEKNKKHKEKKLYRCNDKETCMKLTASSNNKMSESPSSSDSKNTDAERKFKKEILFDNTSCTTSETSTSENSDVEPDNKGKVEKEVKLNTTETSTSNSEQVANERKLKKEVRFNDIKSSSDTSSSDDSDSEQEDELDHKWGELDRDAAPAVEITRRLAVCNMDWDRIQTQDLFVLFNSFKPADGLVKSVKLYPTEYGLKRMKQEEIHGPAELVEKTLNNDSEDVIEENEDEFPYQETVRQYQLNRLKYYYAVVECDAPETANTLYEELDGMEYENSGVHLDLRFIPDDFVFEKEEVSTIDSLPDSLSYKPSMFENAALAQTTVNLTWDETDPRRKEIIERAFADPENPGDDVLALIAPPSSDSSENEEEQEKENEIEKIDRIALYRSLLQSLDKKEDGDDDEDIDMEITFEPGLKEKAEKLVKEKQKEETLTPFEQYIQKKKDKQKLKKKERKAKLKEESQLTDDSDNDHSNQMDGKSKLSYSNEVSSDDDETCLSSKQEFLENEKKLAELALMTSDQRKKTTIKAEKKRKKIKKRKEPKENEIDDFEFNAKDPRFAALYTSHLYNIDPSDPHYKDTKGMRAILEEKQKRKHESFELENTTPGKHAKLSEESVQLLKSVKRKMNK